jgi:hypothetical protein
MRFIVNVAALEAWWQLFPRTATPPIDWFEKRAGDRLHFRIMNTQHTSFEASSEQRTV